MKKIGEEGRLKKKKNKTRIKRPTALSPPRDPPESAGEDARHEEAGQAVPLPEGVHHEEGEQLIALGHDPRADGVAVPVASVHDHATEGAGDHEDEEADEVDPKGVDSHLLGLDAEVALHLWGGRRRG